MPSVKIDSLHAKKEGLSFNTWSSLIAQMSMFYNFGKAIVNEARWACKSTGRCDESTNSGSKGK